MRSLPFRPQRLLPEQRISVALMDRRREVRSASAIPNNLGPTLLLVLGALLLPLLLGLPLLLLGLSRLRTIRGEPALPWLTRPGRLHPWRGEAIIDRLP